MEKVKIGSIWEMIGCFLTALLLVFLFFGGISAHTHETEIYEIKEGWEVRKGEKTVLNIPLTNMGSIFNDVKWNDTFVLSHNLDIKSRDPLIMRIYTRLSAIQVLVDGKLIYSYGTENIAKHRMVGSGYHFILLPTSFYDKEMNIVLMASEDAAIKSAPEIIITPADGAVSTFSSDRMFGIFSGLFMFVAGIFIMILSITAVYMDRRFYPLAIIGLFSAAAGIWCLATIKALQLFSGDVTLNSIMEYLTMYLLPVPALFLSRHFRQSASPRIRKFTFFMTVISGIFFITAFFLQISGIAEVTKVVKYYHILLVPVVLTLLFAGGSKWRRMKAAEKMYQMGMILIVAMVVLEMSVYYLINLVYQLSNRINTVITPLAMMTLTVVMVIGFLLEIYDMRLKDTERKRLQKLAFRDQMTDLMNRGMCEKRFEELKESKEVFVMLDMDLNGLKIVNDKHGHLMGDKYITLFSGIIIKSLGGDRNLYRVGGDEFLYIDTGVTREDMEKKIDFIKKLEKIIGREENIPFAIDASFGVAWSDEVPSGDPEDVYRLADKRMYEMKRSMKKERA
ncbi:MAG: GGDEF domain-containing protein [Lachnospiraceae bacterium]|nr:GGDEF domain-containing protein [Lachnospiraceae bacterium]